MDYRGLRGHLDPLDANSTADLYIRFLMHTEISEYSTKDLLRLSKSEEDGDLAYRALWTVFKRWDDGIDTSFLIDFINTDQLPDKLRGAYFLLEVSPRVDSVKDVVLRLSNDTMAECRRAFVRYLRCSGWHDDIAAEGLANCLWDFDLHVRLEAIEWAIATQEDRFDDVSRHLLEGPERMPKTIGNRVNPWREPILKRGKRALDIARRLRCGEEVATLREVFPEEDSFTFDYLIFFESRLKRQQEKKRKPARPRDGQGFRGL